jgi:CARDB
MARLSGPISSLVVVLVLASSVGCTRISPPAGTASPVTPTSTMPTSQAGSASPTETATGSSETDGASATGTSTDSSQTATEGPTAGNSATGAASPEVDPAGPDITLYTLPECSVVPNGALSGADALTMLVAVRNSGPGSWNSMVAYRVTSDTGLSAEGNTALSTGSGFTAMQVDLSAGDYSRTHHFTITADPNNQIRERDESNNQLMISVALPPRPTGTVNVTCTSP